MTRSPSRPWSSSVDFPLKSSKVFTQSSKLLNSLSRLPSYIFREKGDECVQTKEKRTRIDLTRNADSPKPDFVYTPWKKLEAVVNLLLAK